MGNINHQVNTSNLVVGEYNFDACSVKLGFCERSETKTEVELIPKSEAGREGRRRSADDWSYTLDANDLALFADRGFTGHEHLPWFNLYNMNGRMYDPLVSRFLSPDPYIQDYTSTLDYNRYAYCLNNPLKYTDPSGYYVNNFGRNVKHRGYYLNDAFSNDDSDNFGSRIGGGNFNSPGQGDNGPGANGVYYDWYSNSYRSTAPGNEEVDWGYASSVTQRYASETYTITQTASSLDGGITFIGNGNYSLVRLGNGVESTGLYPTFTITDLRQGEGDPITGMPPSLGMGRIVKGVDIVKKTVVIGENMAQRVIPYAEKYGFKYFNPRGTNPANWMKNQIQWIRRQIQDPGTRIIDYGPDLSRPVRSEYYLKELEMLKKYLGL